MVDRRDCNDHGYWFAVLAYCASKGWEGVVPNLVIMLRPGGVGLLEHAARQGVAWLNLQPDSRVSYLLDDGGLWCASKATLLAGAL